MYMDVDSPENAPVLLQSHKMVLMVTIQLLMIWLYKKY
jgi:hypothetical protein